MPLKFGNQKTETAPISNLLNKELLYQVPVNQLFACSGIGVF
jgi:hypothetical protein